MWTQIDNMKLKTIKPKYTNSKEIVYIDTVSESEHIRYHRLADSYIEIRDYTDDEINNDEPNSYMY
jgi:hypothetical protein